MQIFKPCNILDKYNVLYTGVWHIVYIIFCVIYCIYYNLYGMLYVYCILYGVFCMASIVQSNMFVFIIVVSLHL